MYRGFNLSDIKNFEQDNIALKIYYQSVGRKLLETQKKKVQENLNNYIDRNGILDVSLIEKDWFPNINSHIFISHSHGDENTALFLAGYIYEKFGLECFVDSCVWGYSNDLLKIVDDKYCKYENEQTYNYNKRNRSTAHIHSILSTSLLKMIDKTECLFFLNTPKSVSIEDTINKESFTFSPWIYLELKFSEIVRKKKSENRPIYKYASSNFSQDSKDDSELYLKFKYSIGTKDLVNLRFGDIQNLVVNKSCPWETLDDLYSKTNKILKTQLSA